MATMLSQKLVEAQEANDTVKWFLRKFEVGKLLSVCHAERPNYNNSVKTCLSLPPKAFSGEGTKVFWDASVFVSIKRHFLILRSSVRANHSWVACQVRFLPVQG